MRILGVDVGARRIGLALSDEGGVIAMPWRTIEGGGAKEVARQAGEAAAGTIVVGLPLKLDGSEGEAARKVRAFGAAMKKHVNASIVYWDERLTTVQAHGALREMGMDGRKRRKVVDQTAATLLLQSYLDAQQPRGGKEDR